MKRRIKRWVRLNKAYVIWVSILLIYTVIMLGVIIILTSTDKDEKGSFSSRVKSVSETEVTVDETEAHSTANQGRQ